MRVQVGMGDASENYVLTLASNNAHALAQYAARVERELRDIPGIGAVSSRAGLLQPELRVYPDATHAADLGVTSAAIADTLRIATVGDYDSELAKLELEARQLPIVVRLSDSARRELDILKHLPVPGTHGPVPLESVAQLDVGSGPSELTRHGRLRSIAIEVELGERNFGEVEATAMPLPSLRQRPSDVVLIASGDAEMMGELGSGFALAMATGVLCIYFVLVLLLRDFLQPATILAALVLAVPGAFIALLLSGFALSMPAMIGLIMLMGVTSKNSILLIDYITLARREHALDRTAAIIDACRKRARPIIMTSLAMGAGMLPIALGWGADPSFRAPMAIVVVGGLISSTLLSLLVIPVLYSYVDEGVQLAKRNWSDSPLDLFKPIRE